MTETGATTPPPGAAPSPAVLRYAAFTDHGRGGNPAGAVLDAAGLDDAARLAIAVRVGYSETAFAESAGSSGQYRIRYFSPKAEAAFCGLDKLMAEQGWTTVHLVQAQSPVVFHARDPFPPGGVVEDPATGAPGGGRGLGLQASRPNFRSSSCHNDLLPRARAGRHGSGCCPAA
jgi:predicted PhzF superfamily epimerase YddE/YHI9